MQIFKFNFDTKTKMEKLDDTKYSGIGIRIGKIGNKDVHENVSIVKDGIEINLTADYYKCDAIAFCVGKMIQDNVWIWNVVPSKKIVENAIARNLKTYGTEYYQENN